MKTFMIFLFFCVFSFFLDSKTKTPAKKKVNFEQSVILQGNSQDFNNRCIPKFGKPAKLFGNFVKLQTKLISLHIKLDRANAEDARLSDENTRLHRKYNRLKSIGRPADDLFIEEYKNLLRENDHLVAEGDRLFKKEYIISSKFSSLQLKLNQLQRMFYLSLPLGQPSSYALTESASLLEKQIALMRKHIVLVRKRVFLIKKQIALVKKRIGLMSKVDLEMAELLEPKSQKGDKSNIENSIERNIKVKSRTIASPSENKTKEE